MNIADMDLPLFDISPREARFLERVIAGEDRGFMAWERGLDHFDDKETIACQPISNNIYMYVEKKYGDRLYDDEGALEAEWYKRLVQRYKETYHKHALPKNYVGPAISIEDNKQYIVNPSTPLYARECFRMLTAEELAELPNETKYERHYPLSEIATLKET